MTTWLHLSPVAEGKGLTECFSVHVDHIGHPSYFLVLAQIYPAVFPCSSLCRLLITSFEVDNTNLIPS